VKRLPYVLMALLLESTAAVDASAESVVVDAAGEPAPDVAEDAAVVLPPEDEGCTCRVAATPAAPVGAPFACALLGLARLARRRRR
jgi:MYXO-CTERM domain-containing protein